MDAGVNRFPVPNLGRCSAVVADGYVYAVATDPVCADSLEAQTQNTLQELERLLDEAGSGLAGMLQATVYLSDIANKKRMDVVWLDWIGPETNWPQRACVGAALEDGYLIEVVVTAKVL